VKVKAKMRDEKERTLCERQNGCCTDEKHDCPRFDLMCRAPLRFSSTWGAAGQQADPALLSTRGYLDSFTTLTNHLVGRIGGLWAHLGTMVH